MTIEEYYVSFIQDLLADSGDDFVLNTFVEKMCEIISEQGIIVLFWSFQISEIQGKSKQ